jgi:trehalose synthase
MGIDTKRPILLGVGRLDRWKDPEGIINCYRMAKDEVSDLQLVIITSLSPDDLETFSTLRVVDAMASKDQDIHVYTNIDGMGDIEVNVFQQICTLGIMKSLREGFGLSVSELLWKGKPVLGSKAGGIPLQLAGELEYCLVDSVEECSEKIQHLLLNRDYAEKLGKSGKEHVRQNFLSPRLVRDELKMIKSVLA